MPITKLNSSRDFFRIWFLRKLHAIIAFFLIIGLFMFYAHGTTPVYESKAKVMVMPKPNEELIITAGDDRQREVVRPVTKEDLYTEVELMMSDSVIHETVKLENGEGLGLKAEEKGSFDKVADGITGFFNGLLGLLGLAEEPLSSFDRDVDLLRNSLQIEPAFTSNVLLVNLRGEKPESASQVLDTLLGIYVRKHTDVFTLGAGKDFYDDQAGTYLKRLDDAEQKLLDFNRNYNIVDLENQNAANIGLMTELNKELQLIEIAYEEKKTRTEILKEALETSDTDELLVTAEMRTIPAIWELEKAIIPRVIHKTEIARKYTPVSREYRDIEAQLHDLQLELKREVRKALRTDRLELATLGAKKDSLQGKVKELEANAMEFNQLKGQIENLQRQVDIHKNHYLVYTSKTEDSRVNSEKRNRNLANVSVIDRPTTSERPVSPNKPLLFFVSIILGTLTAICLPFVLEAWDHKLKTADDVESLLSMQVVGSFPEVKS